MIFALLGGDDRSVRLARLLRRDGHRVRPFALEKAFPDCTATAAEAVAGADCIVLPLPSEKDGLVNTPFSDSTYRPAELLVTARPGTLICAGKAGEATRTACREGDLRLADYFLREDFALQNAELTAEGALKLLLEGPRALRGSRVLICGFGRIGRLLAVKLTALGAQVTAAARDPAERALARLSGCTAVGLRQTAGDYDFVVNTIPATVLGERELAGFGGAMLMELASPPYGFDMTAAEALGRRIIVASGLPGKTAPEAAAEAVRDSIYAILEE